LQISLILPIYNEGPTLRNNVQRIKSSMDQLELSYEILLCDDNSNDETKECAEGLCSDSVAYVRFSNRIGKGGTIKNALRICEGRDIVVLDADVPVSEQELESGISLLKESGGLVVGVRRARPLTSVHRKVMSRGFNTLANLLFRTGIEDLQCGFKLIGCQLAKQIFAQIRTDHFAFDIELIARARSSNIPIERVEVNWAELRSDEDSRIPPFRTTLVMLVDLLMLRLSLIGSRNLLSLRRVKHGVMTLSSNGSTLVAQAVTIDSRHRGVLGIARKMYHSIAYPR